jgi:hypothetical protein
MKTIQQAFISTHYTEPNVSVVRRFLNWCRSQEENRLLWLGIIVAGHGCVITPLVLLFVMLAGNAMIMWAFVIAAMGMSLVTNLAALPTKVTLPVFFLSILIDVVVIVNCIVIGFQTP